LFQGKNVQSSKLGKTLVSAAISLFLTGVKMKPIFLLEWKSGTSLAWLHMCRFRAGRLFDSQPSMASSNKEILSFPKQFFFCKFLFSLGSMQQ